MRAPALLFIDNWEHVLEAAPLIELIGKLWQFWLLRGHLSEARRWSEQVLAGQAEVSALARCRALSGASTFLNYQGALDQGQTNLLEALALAASLDARREMRQCLNGLGTNALIRVQYEPAYERPRRAGHVCAQLRRPARWRRNKEPEYALPARLEPLIDGAAANQNSRQRRF